MLDAVRQKEDLARASGIVGTESPTGSPTGSPNKDDSRPPTAPLPREGPPMTLAYERGGMISTHRFESGRR